MIKAADAKFFEEIGEPIPGIMTEAAAASSQQPESDMIFEQRTTNTETQQDAAVSGAASCEVLAGWLYTLQLRKGSTWKRYVHRLLQLMVVYFLWK